MNTTKKEKWDASQIDFEEDFVGIPPIPLYWLGNPIQCWVSKNYLVLIDNVIENHLGYCELFEN